MYKSFLKLLKTFNLAIPLLEIPRGKKMSQVRVRGDQSNCSDKGLENKGTGM